MSDNPPSPRSPVEAPRTLAPPNAHLLQLEPGAPLPPDVPQNAPRYRLVEEKAYKERYPLALPLVIVALLALGVVLKAAGLPGGIIALLVGLGVPAMSVWGERGAVRQFVRDDAGDWVEAARGVPQHARFLRLAPGTPLPPDVPEDAPRYRLIEEKTNAGRHPVAFPLAILALVGCGVGLAAAGAWVGFCAAPLALAVAAVPWGQRGGSRRFVPDDAGEHVEAPRAVVAESLALLAHPVELSPAARWLCGGLGALFLLLLLANLVDLIGGGAFSVVDFLLSAVLGGGLTFLAAKGTLPGLETDEVPPSPWFYSLADPQQRLPDDAPLSGSRTLPGEAGATRPHEESS